MLMLGKLFFAFFTKCNSLFRDNKAFQISDS